MNPAVGPFAIAALLLVVASALKALHPHDTALALRTAGIPATELAVRIGGVAEAGMGITALFVADATLALLVALSYACFVAFVVLARSRGFPISSCGCFGKSDTPPSLLHMGLNVGACVAAIAMSTDPVAAADTLRWPFPESAAFVLLVAVGVLASFVALTLLPRVLASPEVR